jgi:hypothetical protein
VKCRVFILSLHQAWQFYCVESVTGRYGIREGSKIVFLKMFYCWGKDVKGTGSSKKKKKRERREERKVKFRKGLAIDLRRRQYKSCR